MGAAFPLGPVPSYFCTVSSANRNNIFYVGNTPSFTLSKSGANAYTVRDYYGTILASGAVAGTTVTPTAPAGGWKPGWYRLYLTGTSTDSVFGPAYGATTFAVLRADSHFPTTPASGTFPSGGGEGPDFCGKGVLGIGPTRLIIGDVTNLTTGGDTLAIVQADVAISKQFYSQVTPADAARPRPLWVAFPGGTADSLNLAPVGGGNPSVVIYCKDGTVDGSVTTVAVAAGTSTGVKITVANGTNEVYDNLTTNAAIVTALAASAFVRAFIPHFSSSNLPVAVAATAIGNAHFNGVKTVVQTLYPDVQWYEGPSNEPPTNIGDCPELVQQMRLFQGAVKAGNAGAKAMGPCLVSIASGNGHANFLTSGGGTYCDGFSTHIYNDVLGDINLGRVTLAAWVSVLTQYGQQAKPRWQTEQGVNLPIYGVFHPRRSRWQLVQTLLLEQYGIPREQNNVWYDRSHGFWSVPCWWENEDDSLLPQAVMLRVLAEETWGKVWASTLSFGALGDKMWLGSTYTATDTTSVVAFIAVSYLSNGSVTFNLAGSAPTTVTVVDGLGNATTQAVAGGQVTITTTGELPTYLRLPAGCTATVATVNGWKGSLTQQHDVINSYSHSPISSAANPLAGSDGAHITTYPTTEMSSGTSLPDSYAIRWKDPRRIDRVLIWSGMPWQSMAGLIDFDVQTSPDGTTWTTQTTVTKPTPSSFQFGTDSHNVGCQYETYWDEQWVFDVPLPAAVTCQFVRVYARAASYGGEPDAQAVNAGGQGATVPVLTLQEVRALCEASTLPAYI